MQLSYLNNSLKVKYRDVLEIIQEKYPEYMIPNRIPRLYETKKAIE